MFCSIMNYRCKLQRYILDLRLYLSLQTTFAKLKFVLILIVILRFVTLIFIFDSEKQPHIDLDPLPLSKVYSRRQPIILYWDKLYKKGYDHFVPNENTKINCPYKCFHTMDRWSYGHLADVRFFDHRYLNEDEMPPDNPRAINVYHTFEPPYLTFSVYGTLKVPDNYFNATATYRSTSEIYYPYDYFVKKDGTETVYDVWSEEQIEERINQKRKTALSIMTNCGAESKRHDVIKEMQKYIDVTIIGQCLGNAKCGRGNKTRILRYDSRCVKDKLAEHYFYLAFENSVCPEYVTEKFWRMKQLIVPVVLSRAAMPYHIPNDTYIAASDFESPKDLIHYLRYLMKNREAYKKYFNWTKTYRKSRVKEEEIQVSCQLCKMAYNKKVEQIPNFETYWNGSQCMYGYGHDFLNNSKAVQLSELKMRRIMDRTERKRSIGLIL